LHPEKQRAFLLFHEKTKPESSGPVGLVFKLALAAFISGTSPCARKLNRSNRRNNTSITKSSPSVKQQKKKSVIRLQATA
jgi:hypothetical protein